MTFVLGSKSRRELQGVHPDLVRVVELAIQRTEQDFTVFDGIRTASDQRALYNRGASQRDGYSRKSMHQVQESGYGEAVDLVPWIGGKPFGVGLKFTSSLTRLLVRLWSLTFPCGGAGAGST